MVNSNIFSENIDRRILGQSVECPVSTLNFHNTTFLSSHSLFLSLPIFISFTLSLSIYFSLSLSISPLLSFFLSISLSILILYYSFYLSLFPFLFFLLCLYLCLVHPWNWHTQNVHISLLLLFDLNISDVIHINFRNESEYFYYL